MMVGTGESRNDLAKRSSLCFIMARLMTVFKIGEGEQHAWLGAKLERPPRHDDIALRILRQAQAGFHLRDRFPRF